MPFVPPADAALLLGAAMRGTRLIVADDVPGQWWLKDPLRKAAFEHHHRHDRTPWWYRYLDGLDCPFCVGQWVAFGVLGSYAVAATRRTDTALRVWRFVAGALTLNEVAAHLGKRLGDVTT